MMEGPRDRDLSERLADALGRRERLQDALAKSPLDALILASRPNFTYVTGYTTPSWAMTARPLALVVTATNCIAVIGVGEVAPFQAGAPDIEILPYTDPIVRDLDGLILADFAPAVVTGITRALATVKAQRIGIEGSVPSASGLPYGAMLDLTERLSVELVDASPLLWRLRQQKTPFEIGQMRHVGAALGRIYELFQERATPGITARDVHALILQAAGEVGADEVGYLTISIGNGAIDESATWQPGELLYIDTGLVIGGYWADFSRHFAAADVHQQCARDYERIVAAVQAGREASRAGVTAADIAQAIAAEIPRTSAGQLSSIGRVGHGLGLDLTEPPSLSRLDQTTLQPSMTLAIEPLGSFESGVLIAEENIVLTEARAELLSPEFPTKIPLVTA